MSAPPLALESPRGALAHDRAGPLAAGGTLLGALLLRLAGLDARPLGPAEGQTALAALALHRGGFSGYPDGALLANLQSFLFAAFGASDLAARLPAALAGAALTALPLALAPFLGRPAALASALLLVGSPLALLTSRTAGPAGLGALALLLLVVSAARWLGQGDRRWALGVGAGLALGLGSDRAFVPGLLAVGAAAALTWRDGLDLLAERLRDRADRQRLAAGFLVVLFALTTRFLATPAGLGAGLLAPLVGWTGDFVPFQADSAPLVLLLAYELPLLLLAVIGWVAAERTGGASSAFLGAWGAIGLALALLAPGADGRYLLPPLLPLALLAGQGTAALAQRADRARLGSASLAAAALAVPVVYVVLLVAGRSPVSPYGLLLAPAFAALVLVAVWQTADRAALTGLLALGGALLLAFQITGAIRLAYAVPPAEPILLEEALAPDVRVVRAELVRWARAAPERPIVVDERLRPALGWTLRDVPQVVWSAVRPPVPSPAVVAAEGLPPDALDGRVWTRLTLGWVVDPVARGASSAELLNRLLRRDAGGSNRERAIILVR